MISFKNKKILITGATGGIGNALVKKFISLGGTVLGTGTKIEKLDKLRIWRRAGSPSPYISYPSLFFSSLSSPAVVRKSGGPPLTARKGKDKIYMGKGSPPSSKS